MQTETILQGVTRIDIQKIFEDTIRQFKTIPKILYFDTSYLYTFDISDVYYINKFTDKIRISGHYVQEGNRRVFRNPLAIKWHEFCERWFADQTVTIFDKPIKPNAITRALDRVPNEGLEAIAGAFIASIDLEPMKFHAVGSGATAGTSPSPSATGLVTEVDRIDVNEDPGGGVLTRDGSTIFVVGNHDTFVESFTATETGVLDSPDSTVDTMGDYSIFPDEIPHTSGSDAVGSTTVIYQCSS